MTQTLDRARASSALSAIAPLGLGTALSLMGDATLYAVLPIRFAEAGIALASVGLVLSVNRIIRLVTNAPTGWLFDRFYNRRVLFLGSLGIGVLSTVMYALSSDLVSLLLARLLWGMSWSGIFVGGNAIVLQIAPEEQRGRWVGVFQLWFFFGSALGSLVGGMLTDAVGYREALWIGACISAAGALAAWVALPRHHSINARVPVVHRSVFNLRDISLPLWIVAIAQGTNWLVASGIISATIGLVVQERMGAGLQWGAAQIGVAGVTGSLLAGRTLMSLVCAPLAGVWSDRPKLKWRLLVFSLLLGAVGVGLLAVPNIAALLAGTLVGAAATGSIQSLTTTLAGDLAIHRQHGQSMGFLQTAGDVGRAIGPLAAYALLPIAGLSIIFIMCAVLMIANAAWAIKVGNSISQVHPARSHF